MRRAFFDERAEQGRDEGQASTRTDYRCAASGCPNMGGIGGRFGFDRSGTCYYHYAEGDRIKWGEVTRRILADDSMRDPVYVTSPITSDKADPRSWAYALKARDEAGERLTPTQHQMYVRAMGSRRTES